MSTFWIGVISGGAACAVLGYVAIIFTFRNYMR